MKTRFLQCVLDTEARTLRRDDVDVHLTPKAFEVLVMLVSQRPRVVSKAELLDRVWPGTFVTDASLARTIHEIRSAIGDDLERGAVRTVHGHGYAFTAKAVSAPVADHGSISSALPAPAVAWLLAGSRAVPLAEGRHLVGRDPSVSITVDSAQASWHHALLVVTRAEISVEDLGSKNGTLVNGKRLSCPVVLQEADELTFGTARFMIRKGEKLTETQTATRART